MIRAALYALLLLPAPVFAKECRVYLGYSSEGQFIRTPDCAYSTLPRPRQQSEIRYSNSARYDFRFTAPRALSQDEIIARAGNVCAAIGRDEAVIDRRINAMSGRAVVHFACGPDRIGASK